MAQVTNAFDTYEAIGNREDLIDRIFNISPTETPFCSMAKRVKARAVLHEWQTDTLAAASTANAQLEGDETARAVSAPTTRPTNTCQISGKNATVTGTQEAVNKAGRSKEMGYQMAKRSLELKRDLESILTQNQGATTGDATTARTTRSFESWISTNTSRGTGGADGTQTTGATDGTQRAFTETLLKDVLQQVFVSGGNPTTLMVGPVNKQNVSGFVGRTQARQNIGKTQIQAAASMYASDFGDLKVVPNRFSRDRTALVIDPEYVKVAYLRKFVSYPVAKIGDAETREIKSEYALEMCNEAAHGVIADLTV